jgi:hypothetical protein
VTIMPTWPVIERTIVRAVDWSVVAIPVIGIAVAVIGSVMVIMPPSIRAAAMPAPIPQPHP